jgi:formate dehydrogenase major subunit
MLRKKTNGVARGPRTESILLKAAQASVDRRAFLRGSGLAIGGLTALAATGGTVTKAEAAAAARQPRSEPLVGR